MIVRELLAAFMVVVLVSATASAVTIQIEITPDSLKQKGAPAFSVSSEMRKDGLVHFTVIHKLTDPRWLNASLVVQKGDTCVAETHFPAVVREDSITYYLSVSPDFLADSTLELSEHAIGGVGDRQALPSIGGTDYLFRLKKFAPEMPRKETASEAKQTEARTAFQPINI
jgi:hypothetical protein